MCARKNGKPPAIEYSRREGWAKAAPSNVDEIYGYERQDDLLEGFSVYTRVTPISAIISGIKPTKFLKENRDSGVENDPKMGEKGKQSQKCYPNNNQQNTSSDGKNTPNGVNAYGRPIGGLTPYVSDSSTFDNRRAVWESTDLAVRCSGGFRSRQAVWVAFDTEYVGGENVPDRWDGQREVVSWQLGFGVGDDFYELLIIPRTDTALSVDNLLYLVAFFCGAKQYRYKNFPRCVNKDGKWDGKSGTSKAPAFKVVVFAHSGLVDWSTLIGGKYLIQHTSSKGAALFSIWPVSIAFPTDKRRTRFIRASVNVRDLMSFADEHSSLRDIGDAVGLPKLDMSEEDYLNMSVVLENEPERFAEYAIRDVEIVYRYMSQLPVVERDTICPTTIPACSANYVRNYIKMINGYTDRDFEAYWRGEEKVKDGLELCGRQWVPKEHYKPVSAWAGELIRLAKDSMRGGVNAADVIGYFADTSWDYDLKSAYPLALGSLYDPDYMQPFAATFENVDLDEQSFPHDWLRDPFVPGFGVVQFEFPPDTYHPCIAVRTEHGLVFPLTTEGTAGVPVTMPEVMLALKMGAKVKAIRFVVPRVHNRDGILLDGYHELIRERNRQKSEHGGRSVQQKAIKLVNNAAYGKLAQELTPKKHRDLWSLETDEIQPSKITSSPHASAGTALVRCVVIAAINQLHELGYDVYSATTDGFISNAPKNVLDSIDLYGLRYRLSRVIKIYSDGDTSDIFEIKHTNTDGLLNFTTRGNVGLNVSPDPEKQPELEGVFARNGYKGYKSGSLEDRKEFAKRIVSRSAPLEYKVREWVNAADMLKYNEDFHTTEHKRSSNPNFDLKRKPRLDTMHDVQFEIDGEMFSTPTYDTEPYSTVKEFKAYKICAAHMQLVRLGNYTKLGERAVNYEPGEPTLSKRDLVRYAIVAYRHDIVDIPAIDGLRGQERLDFISAFLDKGEVFSANDWKNAGRDNRVKSLPEVWVYLDVVHDMGGRAKEEDLEPDEIEIPSE